MSRLNIPPTKSNQLGLKHDLGMAREGFKLLDQKREILVLELMRMLESVRRLQEKLEEVRVRAFSVLKRATAKNGFHLMQNLADGARYEHRIGRSTMPGDRGQSLNLYLCTVSERYIASGTAVNVDSPATVKIPESTHNSRYNQQQVPLAELRLAQSR
jgi:V/A-type H+/Na+-transporting ATPase subunit D